MRSRLATVEQRRKRRRAFLLIILSALLLAGFLSYGPNAIGQLTGFIFRLKQSEVSYKDTIAPVAPTINSLPEATNKKTITLTGSAEAGSTLKIFLNGKNVKDTLVDNSAVYSLEVELEEGENEIWATATDQAGNESPKSRKVIINFDTKPPDLEIESPKDGEQFYGKDKIINVRGKTEAGSTVSVNGRIASTSVDGQFFIKLPLNEGENKLQIQAVDKAGNTTQKEITITYLP